MGMWKAVSSVHLLLGNAHDKEVACSHVSFSGTPGDLQGLEGGDPGQSENSLNHREFFQGAGLSGSEIHLFFTAWLSHPTVRVEFQARDDKDSCTFYLFAKPQLQLRCLRMAAEKNPQPKHQATSP